MDVKMESSEPVQDAPEDLSMKSCSTPERDPEEGVTKAPTPNHAHNDHNKSPSSQSPPHPAGFSVSRRSQKFIPPPLDLNARTLHEPPGSADAPRLPKSPGDLPRECLPIRKRPLLEVRRDLHDSIKSPKSAGPNDGSLSYNFGDYRNVSTAPSSPLSSAPPTRLPLPSSTLSLTPSSACSLSSSNHSAFNYFPVPPTSTHPHHGLLPPGNLAAAAALASAANLPKSPFLAAAAAQASSNGYPTPPLDLHSPYAWASMFHHSPFSPVLTHSPLPFPTALLSPAPSSYPSSTNSSREDLPLGSNGESDSKKRYLSAGSSTAAADSTSPVPSSPLLSPRNPTWSHSWPTPAWQCFVAGTMIKFLITGLDAPWQRVDDLAWKDKIAMKIDARNNYKFAPNGLTIVKIDVINREQKCDRGAPGGENENESVVQTLLSLRMAPHRGESSTEVQAETSLDHPFFVKEKGWCSAQPRLTVERYGIPCQEIAIGDVCLPPNHPEAVRTPDLCDRFRRFEFTTPKSANSISGGVGHGSMAQENAGNGEEKAAKRLATVAGSSSAGKSMMSPPMSPAKTTKKEKDPNKPKRPMNGFMLFAKKFRLELIQMHPGKDNRAISVLLGESWKKLPQSERDSYSQKAKLMADEQKKLHPDCWKRKRTINASSASATSTSATTTSVSAASSVSSASSVVPSSPTTAFHPPISHTLTAFSPVGSNLYRPLPLPPGLHPGAHLGLHPAAQQ